MSDPYLVLLFEIVIVLLIGFIRVPPAWADVLLLELLGSIAAYAWMGLVAWLLLAGGAWLLVAERPDREWITATLDFIRHHPLLALGFGPLMSVLLRYAAWSFASEIAVDRHARAGAELKETDNISSRDRPSDNR